MLSQDQLPVRINDRLDIKSMFFVSDDKKAMLDKMPIFHENVNT